MSKSAVSVRRKPATFSIDVIINSIIKPLFHSPLISLIATGLSLLRIVGGYNNVKNLQARKDLRLREKASAFTREFLSGWNDPRNRLVKYYLVIRLIKTINAVGTRLVVDRTGPRTIQWHKHVVVVTGGARGLCGHVVVLLRLKGATVVVLDLPEKTEHGMESLYIQTDVTDIESLEKARRIVEEKVGYTTMLVLGAGIARHHFLLDNEQQFPYHLARQVSEVNADGVVACLKTFGQHMLPEGGVQEHPHMQAQNGWGGHILIIGSGTAYIELPANGTYNASKSAVVSLYTSLLGELTAYHKVNNVRASLFCPAKIETKLTEGRMKDTGNQFLFPTLTVSQAGGKIVEMLEGDKSRTVFLPRSLYAMTYMSKVLPPWLMLTLLKDSMGTFMDFAKENRHTEANIHQR